MLAFLRPRLPVLIGAALALVLWAELAFVVPAGTPHRAVAVGLGPCVALCLLGTLPHDDATSFTGGLFVIAISLVIGRLLRSRAALNRALREKAALLERHREDAAGRAVLDERTRIAGELHDVVAHALSAMTVQATGARRLASTRPELARAAFGAIENAGREALDELRRLLGVLRLQDAELTLTPQPSLRHVGSLVRRTTSAGLPVTLTLEGEARDLPAGLDVTAYRVVQDALAAALSVGGAGRAEVRLRFTADALEILVRDDGWVGANTAARPLIGTRERVTLHGGRFTSGARPTSGGHVVRATLPLDGGTMIPAGEPLDPLCEIAERGDRALRHLRSGPTVQRDPLGTSAANAAASLGYTLPLAWLAGRAVRARLSGERHETAARLAEANEDAQRQAAVEERRRIARELHDLVAHAMSVMVVQAGGARRILDQDPARALEAATRIERTGREALGEMRQLLGVLNGADQPPALAPQPTLAEIGELVTRARNAGLPTTLEFRGERRALPAGLDLAAYRIVQEGLTNALKHADHAHTTVVVDWSAEHALTLEIRDHGAAKPPTGSSGHGLVGMRERVKLYGGELDTGPASSGGWRVRATLPMTVRELSPV